MECDARDIEPRPLTARESTWIREILQSSQGWENADISRTKVVAEGPCDEGVSILLRAPEPENPDERGPIAGYVGRIVICTSDGGLIEVRLTQSEGRLQELFVLFVDPQHPRRKMPDSWTESSHEVVGV
jgi:hypothetical protein